MADLRIVDAPEIPTNNITGREKIPTGGSGNYSITLDSLADYTKTKKDLTDKTYVDNQLANKANNVDVYTKAETYTKQESYDLINDSISTELTPVNTSLDLAKRGIANRYDPLLTYNSGERVVLTNGDIVKSTIDGNANNPNVDMTGWTLFRDSKITIWSGRTQEERNRDYIHLKDFGAVPNNSSFDNTNIIKIALESGQAIDFGDSSCNYYISGRILPTLTNNLYYKSNGASITCLNVMKSALEINANGFNVNGDGALNIDGALKAFSGLVIYNEVSAKIDTVVNSLVVRNCRRSSTLHTGGDGVLIRGNLGRVVLNDTKIDGVYMAAGAGVLGSQGVTGITVVRSTIDNSYIPEQVTINNPKVINVISEDLDYAADQDGIKVFTLHSQPTVLPSRTSVVINNPYFHNCLGRAVKSQAELCVVQNPVIYRDVNPTRGYGYPELDFQVGGGKVINAQAIYKNARPNSLVYMYASGNPIKNSGLHIGSVDGFTVSLDYDAPTVVDLELIRINYSDGCDYQNTSIKNVNVRGKNVTFQSFLQISRTGVAPVNATVTLENCSAPIDSTGGVLTVQDAMQGQNLIVNLNMFKNVSTTPAQVTISRFTNMKDCRVVDCVGLAEAFVGDSALPVNFINGLKEYGEMPIKGDRRGGGSVRFGKYRLLSGANTINLGGYAGYVNSNLLLLNIAHNRNSIGIFFVDKNGMTTVSIGAEMSNGSNAPSGSPALFDIWVTTDNVLHINNTFGTVFATVQILG